MTRTIKQATVNARIMYLLSGSFLPQLQAAGIRPTDNLWSPFRVGKSLPFKIYEGSPERADTGIKIGRFSAFEIGKKALNPW